MAFQRLVRFVPKGVDEKTLIGEPVDSTVDVGTSLRNGEDVEVKVFTGHSVLAPGSLSDRVEIILRLLSPLSANEVGTIRAVGLNYKGHAQEVNMATPDIPTIFLKPAPSIADPWPAPTVIPKHTLKSGSADYEAELAVVIGKTAKDVPVDEAMDYVLGYTACNDISNRAAQLAQTQWCYSKGFDGSCPLGPTLVSKEAIGNIAYLKIRGLKNGRVLQESEIGDMIFSIPELISFISQGTTLPAGTVIITGTPAGIGAFRKPTEYLHDGDEFVVEILPHIGSLHNVIQNEE